MMTAILFASMLLASALTVDGNLPAGNVVVEKIEGDAVFLHQDLRDTDQDWIYWKFRVTGAAGRTLHFKFTKSAAVGSRSAAVSTDCGKTWIWGDDLQPAQRREPKTNDHPDWKSFSWTFGPKDDEVWFSQTIPYDAADWRAFLDRHAADSGRLFEEGVLCKSRKGRDVEYARFGRLDGKAAYRIFVSSRHHCGEATATFVLEGVLEQVFADDDLGRWLRENVEFRVVPFADKDGVVDGDQGKRRKPHDHARDYSDTCPVLYPEVRAIMEMLRTWQPSVVNDFHCPWLRSSWFVPNSANEFVYQVGLGAAGAWEKQQAFGRIVERVQEAGLEYRQADDFRPGQGWNNAANWTQGKPLIHWAADVFTNVALVTTFEIPFANQRFKTLYPAEFRAFGRDIALAYRAYLAEEASLPPIDGVYPHLAMSNDEGECGTGAVVPWAGSLWVVTYGPHCPLGSTDKLYQIKPDLTRVVRSESVGGTPADRLIHRETNQLLIGPYVIDAKGNVRVVPPSKMPGRLTGAARHLVDPANLVYVATMDNGLYALDMRTLAVKTLQRDHNGVDGKIWGQSRMMGFPALSDWDAAVDNVLPGSHTKGMCTGFGRVQLANNGEYHPEAKTNPWIPAGVLGDCAPDGTDQRVIRRCQFTDITTRDGIYGNEHPETNPVWALGWDAKSVIFAVTTNGSAWTYYRLPKGSHCYDGAHGWNTEWPRIREAGLGDGNLLATMHGTFWRFPQDFSPASPNGIRPLSTYLKVIGDFCWWQDVPNGGSIVFGCDDHAKSAFLGTRKLKADQPKNVRSTSNLWFVKPEELTTFGPPTGEGWVWHGEDVKAGDLSDPYLWAGYSEREFTCVDAAGRAVSHELVHEGDWVRVKALAAAKGVRAHFVYGLPKPAALPALDAKRPTIDITDDNGKTFRFPNVNGDTTVLCREVATERDLLYVGGVFYELPAENAGGFACLRPIALADASVTSIAVDRGLIVINGKRRVLDSLWKNGTAPQAYWLWREHFREMPAALAIDGNLPAGNIVVEKVEGDTVLLRPDLRDTKGDWFYWAFRVKGAKGRTLTFDFAGPYGGTVVGVRGPAVTTDGGKTWSYPCDGKSTSRSFSYTFDTDGEVRFYETWQYLPPDWEAFLAAHATDRGKKFETGVLCTSHKGRSVPKTRFGCLSGAPKYRIFMASRHHCSEATATAVLEGVAAAFLADDELGRWLCANVELMLVPFTDYDGVVDGDQGKNRKPHDHNRDYTEFLYPETRAIRDWIGTHAGGKLDIFIDAHCPWIRDGEDRSKASNEFLYTPWKDPKIVPDAAAEKRFSQLLEQLQCGSMRYRASDDLPFGKLWNNGVNYNQGRSAVIWACQEVKGLRIARTYEVPFANANGAVVTPDTCRDLGRDTAKVFRAVLEK